MRDMDNTREIELRLNGSSTHRKSGPHNIESAVALMAVVEIVAPLAMVVLTAASVVPKAPSEYAPIAITKIVHQAVVIKRA